MRLLIVLIHVLHVLASGSFAQEEGSTLSSDHHDFQPEEEDSVSRSSVPGAELRHEMQFPFFRKNFPDDEDHRPFQDHPFLRLKVTRRNSTEGADEENDVNITKARIYIWPQTDNCEISGLLTNGVVRKRATFLVEKANYSEGLCMTATPEISPNGHQTAWTMALDDNGVVRKRASFLDDNFEDFKSYENFNKTYEVVLEGNGTIEEWHIATWLVIGLYVAFCVGFFVIWYLIVYPGDCL